MRDPKHRIEDMLQAIENIQSHVQGGREVFDRDEMLQVYVVHYLTILGEAAFKLPESFCAQYPYVPWDSIRGMRHILVHDYFRVNLNVVWGVVQDELPALKAQLESIQAALRARE